MKYLLDTNICILLFGPSVPPLLKRIGQCNEGELRISAITFAEIAWGSWHGKPLPVSALDGFVREVPILSFDGLAAKYYAGLEFRRASFDRLIAAHALALGLTLVTNNERDFADIPGLRIENWTL